MVYQRCYLLIQDTTDCNRDFPFWDKHMYMYIIFMFSYISQLEKKACYIHKSFKKYYVLHVYTYVYCHCMYRLCIQWLIYWQKNTSLTAPRAICTCRATWERQEFNSDKEINNKIKIHQYKTQHRFMTHCYTRKIYNYTCTCILVFNSLPFCFKMVILYFSVTILCLLFSIKMENLFALEDLT